MIALLLALLVAPTAHVPVAHVQVGQVEAVFVPSGWAGPIVAAPFGEVVFE